MVEAFSLICVIFSIAILLTFFNTKGVTAEAYEFSSNETLKVKIYNSSKKLQTVNISESTDILKLNSAGAYDKQLVDIVRYINFNLIHNKALDHNKINKELANFEAQQQQILESSANLENQVDHIVLFEEPNKIK